MTMQSMLLGISPADPLSLAGTAIVLLVVVVIASLIPATRAARIEPTEALRSE